MKVETAWVAPPQTIGGLDHLGTQAPCVLVYSQLLPGITNVTDRARYYSFYPWFIWSIDRRYPNADIDAFIDYYRRADCLFTLIAERHSRTTDSDSERHGVAMVGRVQLVPALDPVEAGVPLRLSEYTAADSEHRYFKNQLGGLGQYYAGTLAELELLDPSARPWIKYTMERGEPLARALDQAVPGDRFWAVIEKDTVNLSDLDALASFCPCHLAHSVEERRQLTELFFDRQNSYEREGEQRRKSLALVLHLTQTLRSIGNDDLSEDVFRACVYSAYLPGRTPWTVPESLRRTRECWAIYQRNDLLSVACQTVLAVCLRELEMRRYEFPTAESFAASFSQASYATDALSSLGAATFGELSSRALRSGPTLAEWEHNEHEMALAERMVRGWWDSEPPSGLLQLALRILAVLAGRDDAASLAYGHLAIPQEALTDYPINLAAFRARANQWRDQSLSASFGDLVQWCLNTHLRVALRKLRQTGRATFHLRPSELGLETVGEVPPPARTTPRFRQAVQILRDIGALSRDPVVQEKPTGVTPAGSKLLEEACA